MKQSSPSTPLSNPSSSILLFILGCVGLILSLYALHVDSKLHEQNDNDEILEPFVALCDIKLIGASCSKVFTLPIGHMVSYFRIVPKGHILDVPNAMIGAVFYTIQILIYLSLLISNILHDGKKVNKLIALLIIINPVTVSCAMIASILLAFHLTFIVYDLCILCWSTHIINSIFFYYHVIQPLSSNQQEEQESSSTTHYIRNGVAKIKFI